MEEKRLRSLKLRLSAIISKDNLDDPLGVSIKYYKKRLKELYDEPASDTDINEAVSELLIREEEDVIVPPDDYYEGF